MASPASRPTLLRRAAFSLVVLLGLVGGTELLLRLVFYRSDLLFSWERGALVRFDETGALIAQAGTVIPMTDGPYEGVYRTNGVGLREDHELTREIPRPGRRYLAVGDSWIFGTSLTQGRTIPDRIEVHLQTALGEPVEVANAGLLGMGAFDIYMAWRRYASMYAFDGVILGTPHNAHRQKEIDAAHRTVVANAPSPTRSGWYGHLLLRRGLYYLRAPTSPEGVAGQDSSLVDLLRLVDEVHQSGLPVYFLQFPTNYETVGKGHFDRGWADALAARGVPMAQSDLRARACWGFLDEDHPSEAGADVLGYGAAQLIASGEALYRPSANRTCATAEGRGPGKPPD